LGRENIRNNINVNLFRVEQLNFDLRGAICDVTVFDVYTRVFELLQWVKSPKQATSQIPRGKNGLIAKGAIDYN